MFLLVILIGVGIIFLVLGNISKQKQGSVCYRCGSEMFTKTCPKCGYVNYSVEESTGNTIFTVLGVLFIIVGIISIPVYNLMYESDDIGNDIINIITSVIEVDENNTIVINNNKTIEPNNNQVTNEPSTNTNTNTNTNTKTNTNTTQTYSVTTSGVGTIVGPCRINSFTGKMTTLIGNRLNFSYTINLTETSGEQTNNQLAFKTCNFTVYLFDENNNLIAKWNDFEMIYPSETKNHTSFKYIDNKGYKYSALVKAN